MKPLHALASDAGLQRLWENADGAPQIVSDEVLVTVLGRLGFPAGNSAAIDESRRLLAAESLDCRFLSADVEDPIRLPGEPVDAEAELRREDGSTRPVRIEGSRLSGIGEPGYYDLQIGGRLIRLAIAPRRCFRVQDAAPGRRIWAPAVQVPALRGDRESAFGDFAALRESAAAFASRGADAISVSPLHALFPADPTRYSPYAPSSRLFLNVLFGDPRLVEADLGPEGGGSLIDWEMAIPGRMQALRRAFEERPDHVRDQVAAFAGAHGQSLVRHATFDALHGHFFESGAHGWRAWPKPFQDAEGDAVAQFAGENAEEIEFHLFLQWLAERSIEAVQRAAREGGMAVGLITDLAVGLDPGGSQAWSRPEDLLAGLSIGAPPDELGPEGQNWGLAGFAPRALRRGGFGTYIETLRANLRHAGGMRIDHILGLRRLWVIPDGAGPVNGVYLTMPLTDMLRIAAIESQRARAIIIGEDLGTVPDGLRSEMSDRGVLGMQVLWFERDENGEFMQPRRWRADAAAMTSTHDLPTVAGWWRGCDIDWALKLGRTSGPGVEKEKRAADRERLWAAFVLAGVAEAPMSAPEQPEAAVDAALAYVSAAPSVLTIIPFEDILGIEEQPNLPGTTDQHPNWRRRLPRPTEAMLSDRAAAARLRSLARSPSVGDEDCGGVERASAAR
ncbi:4-alpha-glucanotransferase [Inquilinus limosus]|uniref:4-alpha-glucanotransferase n=1 Tax=Inquilinus limosus TaxID=171674 RepID=UPI003F1437BC